MPFGSACGHRRVARPFRRHAEDPAGVLPPAAGTLMSVAPAIEEDAGVVVCPVPPKFARASSSVTTAPPLTEIFFDCRRRRTRAYWPSGLKNGCSRRPRCREVRESACNWSELPNEEPCLSACLATKRERRFVRRQNG